MNLLVIGLIFLGILFAVNMGGSGIAPTFSAEYGGGIISRKKASILFAIFVLLGAYLLGFRVVKVISKGLINPELLNIKSALIIFTGTTIALFLANLFKIPASTSQITVFSIVGYGAYHNAVKWEIFQRMIPLWIVLPFSAFLITFLCGKFIYPKIKDFKHNSIKFWDILTSCYTAFSIGSNNVANASGVFAGAQIMTSKLATFILAPFFGIGGFVLGKGNLQSIGKKVTQLDLISAGIISLVTGSLLISASLIGLPQSLVQLNSFAVFGFGVANRGKGIKKLGIKTIKKCFLTWIMSPILGFSIVYLIATIINKI